MKTCKAFDKNRGHVCYNGMVADLYKDVKQCCDGVEHPALGKALKVCKQAIKPLLKRYLCRCLVSYLIPTCV
jgi:hypothetical protein